MYVGWWGFCVYYWCGCLDLLYIKEYKVLIFMNIYNIILWIIGYDKLIFDIFYMFLIL